MHFRSLNEILASLVRILNIVRFEFQIQTLFFYSNQTFWHLFCNSKSYVQVYPSKFTFVKIKSRRNFREFIWYFQKVWIPLKFIKCSKNKSVPWFLTLFLLGIWSQHNWQSCSEYYRLSSYKNWEFWENYKASISILKFESVLDK
jgi:hypothetical protein